MTASGQKLMSNRPIPSSALTSTADITHEGCEVRKAMNGLMHRRKQQLYSITSSVRVSNVAGMTRSSVLAVLTLTANSNLIGCFIGKSLAFVPQNLGNVNGSLADTCPQHD